MLGFHSLSETPLSTLTEEVTSKQESASNAVTFGQQTSLNYNISRTASNSVSFSQQVEHNFKFRNASSGVLFGQQADNNFKLESTSNTLTFGQQASAVIELPRSISNSIVFGQVISNNAIFISASNSISFAQQTETDVETLQLTSGSIVFSQEVIGFIPAPNVFRLEAPCEGPTAAILLPNPNVEDSEALEHQLNFNRSMNGTRHTYVKSSTDRKLIYEFSDIGRGKILEVQAFLKQFRGKRIRLTNFRGEIWKVFINQSGTEFQTNKRSFNSGGARKEAGSFTLEFIGQKIRG